MFALPGSRVLEQNAPGGVSSATVKSWISKLKIRAEKRARLKEAVGQVTKHVKEMSADRAAGWGFPVAMAAKAKQAELTKILCAATILSS